MQRIRIPVLAGLAVAAVLAFLLAPSTGLFARVPVMVLCGVLGLIWHLAVTGARPEAASLAATTAAPTDSMPSTTSPSADGPSSSATPSTPSTSGAAGAEPAAPVAAAEHRPGYFELDAEPVPAVRSDTVALARPMPPASPAPLAGLAELAELAELPDPPANWPPGQVDVPLVFQLTDDGTDLESLPELQVIDLTEPSPPRSTPVGVGAAADGEDPWLAFAASMFREQV